MLVGSRKGLINVLIESALYLFKLVTTVMLPGVFQTGLDLSILLKSKKTNILQGREYLEIPIYKLRS